MQNTHIQILYLLPFLLASTHAWGKLEFVPRVSISSSPDSEPPDISSTNTQTNPSNNCSSLCLQCIPNAQGQEVCIECVRELHGEPIFNFQGRCVEKCPNSMADLSSRKCVLRENAEFSIEIEYSMQVKEETILLEAWLSNHLDSNLWEIEWGFIIAGAKIASPSSDNSVEIRLPSSLMLKGDDLEIEVRAWPKIENQFFSAWEIYSTPPVFLFGRTRIQSTSNLTLETRNQNKMADDMMIYIHEGLLLQISKTEPNDNKPSGILLLSEIISIQVIDILSRGEYMESLVFKESFLLPFKITNTQGSEKFLEKHEPNSVQLYCFQKEEDSWNLLRPTENDSSGYSRCLIPGPGEYAIGRLASSSQNTKSTPRMLIIYSDSFKILLNSRLADNMGFYVCFFFYSFYMICMIIGHYKDIKCVRQISRTQILIALTRKKDRKMIRNPRTRRLSIRRRSDDRFTTTGSRPRLSTITINLELPIAPKETGGETLGDDGNLPSHDNIDASNISYTSNLEDSSPRKSPQHKSLKSKNSLRERRSFISVRSSNEIQALRSLQSLQDQFERRKSFWSYLLEHLKNTHIFISCFAKTSRLSSRKTRFTIFYLGLMLDLLFTMLFFDAKYSIKNPDINPKLIELVWIGISSAIASSWAVLFFVWVFRIPRKYVNILQLCRPEQFALELTNVEEMLNKKRRWAYVLAWIFFITGFFIILLFAAKCGEWVSRKWLLVVAASVVLDLVVLEVWACLAMALGDYLDPDGSSQGCLLNLLTFYYDYREYKKLA